MQNKIKVGDKETSFSFRKLTQRELFELDRYYRKIFGECVKLGLMTEKQALRLYEKNDSWGKDQEKQISEHALKLNELSNKINLLDEFNEESNSLVSEMISERAKLTSLIGEKIELFRQTAEGTAGQERIFLFVKIATTDENGKSIFKTNEDLENYSSENPDDFGRILTAAYLYQQGIDANKEFTDDWAEVAFITRASKKQLEKNEQENTIDNKDISIDS